MYEPKIGDSCFHISSNSSGFVVENSLGNHGFSHFTGRQLDDKRIVDLPGTVGEVGSKKCPFLAEI